MFEVTRGLGTPCSRWPAA